MSEFKFEDNFNDLRNWTGTGYLETINFFSEPTAVRAGVLMSKNIFFGVQDAQIRVFDTMTPFTLTLSLENEQILVVSADSGNYTVTEGGTITTGSVARTDGWHLIQVEIRENYRISIDGTNIFQSIKKARKGFEITLTGGIWDDLLLEKTFENEYQAGTGTMKDLQIKSVEILDDASIQYRIRPGYFYVDDIEYYYFADMGIANIIPNPSGSWTGPSGLFYRPGEPYFVVTEDDIVETSGYTRTPFNKDYVVSWEPVENSGLFLPTISGAFDPLLVYERGEERLLTTTIPIDSTQLVLSDEGGDAATVRSDSSYIDYANVGEAYQAFAEVKDKFGGPVSGAVVQWKTINGSDLISMAGSSITNSRGIATTSIPITEAGPFHVFAQVNPHSQPDWIRTQLSDAELQVSVFQLDNSGIWFDSRAGRAAMGQNAWGEFWGVNPGEPTGLSFPSPTTHGQWEDEHPQYRRPPDDQNLASNEANGSWNATDFSSTYPSIAPLATLQTFMNPLVVARKGYWGQMLVSGLQIRNDSPIAPSQVLNPTSQYEIVRDYAVTIGSYNDVHAAGGAHDSVFYVFYQPGSEYSGSSVDPAGDFYFRGVAVYEESLSQVNSQVQDIISNVPINE